ncbi:MAG TPA: UDP-N-acetylmuramate dehydrogenase [Verrucomicrobiae bacterium]|jgi:UDP-N-acetylenolpyruvoylglucosamine reductase|nr:UDP-N-acetylmuramate dehydrogenase [Verrucomicrobiae bacterium]
MSSIAEKIMPNKEQAADELAKRLSPETVLRRDEPLAKRTTLRVGGPADIYVEPVSEEEVAAVLKFCGEHDVKFFVLGRGSNLLVRDGGFRGVVISLAAPFFSRIEIKGERLHCGAGAKLKNVAVEAKRNGLAGLEFLEGIPGTVGGALRMNAGAMASATFDTVESVRMMDFTGNAFGALPNELAVEYRSCATLKTHIALSAVLKAHPDSRESIEQRMIAFSKKRWTTQPAAPSAGCAFKNPAAMSVGKIIDELHLKGARVGGAFVSAEHGNFIVNDGTATARDVLELIEKLRQHVKAERGIELHTEVEVVGED